MVRWDPFSSLKALHVGRNVGDKVQNANVSQTLNLLVVIELSPISSCLALASPMCESEVSEC